MVGVAYPARPSKADILLRGIPWTLLILNERQVPNALNANRRPRFGVVLVGVGPS